MPLFVHSFFYFRPHPGEIRQIYIEKSSEALGITIKENQAKKGVFVSSVSENSLANQVGLQVRKESLSPLLSRQIPHETTVFKNYRKSRIQQCERSELSLHFEWTKVH